MATAYKTNGSAVNRIDPPNLLQVVTYAYKPTIGIRHHWAAPYRRHIFTLPMVDLMMADPRIVLGTEMIRGPLIQSARFFVKTKNDELKEFLKTQITRFWRTSAERALKCLEWGYSGSEVIYQSHNGQISFDCLKDLYSLDTRPVLLNGELVGMTVQGNRMGAGTARGSQKIFIGNMKAFWHVHWRHYNIWFGRSRLYGAFPSWEETWSDGGFRDIRRLFFHKYSYDGGKLYHPEGNYVDQDGVRRSWASYALEILEKKKTGGVWTFPNTTDERGNRVWEHEHPQITGDPGAISAYGHDLRTEMLEGIGIPPEVLQASETGSGFAGRRIPQQGFYQSLQGLVNWLIFDFDQQVLSRLVRLNFGDSISRDYEVIPFGLLREESSDGNTPARAFVPQGADAEDAQLSICV